MRVIPPVARVVVHSVLVHPTVDRHGVRQLAQNLVAHTKGDGQDEHLVPQDEVTGNRVVQIGEVLEPTLERLAAIEQLNGLGRMDVRALGNDRRGDGKSAAKDDER